MAQTFNLKIAGLHTYNSSLSGVPEGALTRALNLNINRLNLAECRRGFNNLTYSLPGGSDRVKSFVSYDEELFAHYTSTFAIYNSGSGWSSKGSLTTPSNTNSVRYATASKNLYLTSNAGIKKLDGSSTSAIYAAGLPKGTFIELALASGTGTAVTEDSYVTYRYLIGRRDANDNLVYGGVSGRYTTNTVGAGATKNIEATVYLPSGLSTDHFVQLYRTEDLTVEGSDEMFLCYETNLTSTNISDGYVLITDITPEDLLGETLYTSPSQEQIIADNAEPPLARDIAVYQGHMFYADIEDKHRFSFNIISCGSPGLQVDDTITISDGSTTEVYTAKAAYSAGSKHFVVDTASGSLAVRIAATATSLVKLINSTSALVYAYLESTGSDSLPGRIALQARSLGSAQFNLVSTRAVAFNPQLESTANANQYSDNTATPNGLAFSKRDIPEAVPLVNQFTVGNNSRIKRIMALRDGLFIFKELDGVWVLRGNSPSSFTVSPLDTTANLVADKSIQTVSNQIYGLFEGGVGRVSDSGIDYISVPIKDQLLPLYAAPLTQLQTLTFGVSYETEGKYILSLPQTSSDTYTTKQYVWDIYGNTWVEWDLQASAAHVHSTDGKLLYGLGASNGIKQERKSHDFTDYADQISTTVTISDYSGTTLTITNTDDMTVGDLLIQGDLSAYIESIDLANSQITIDYEQAWTTGAATVELLGGIDCQIEWNADTAGNPAGFKQFYENTISLQQNFVKTATVTYRSDSNPSESSLTISAPTGNGAWGEFIWGEVTWGGESVETTRLVGVPREHSRCNKLMVGLTTQAAYNDFQINGLALTYNPISTRTSR